jgi:putative nucleotidyltransferase with HDIG domain/PAS domain S-box-containing protein
MDAWNLISDGVFVLDRNWNYVYLNDAGARLIGRLPDELVGKNIWEQFPEAIGTAFERKYREAAQTGKVVEFEAHFDPLGRWYSLRVFPSPDGLTIIYQEVTERHRAEAEVRQALAVARAAEAGLNRSLDHVVEALSKITEFRDTYTSGHQRRVATLARAIAREMGWSEADASGVWVAAMIHDIGKVAVPSEILNKPGKLSELEFELIKSHPQIGFDVVKDVEFAWPVAQSVLQHHERLDGSGYPSGCAGSEICPGARVLAVADTVEAMQSRRPHREELGLDAALETIAAGRETLYDPVVVDACIKLFRELGFQLD